MSFTKEDADYKAKVDKALAHEIKNELDAYRMIAEIRYAIPAGEHFGLVWSLWKVMEYMRKANPTLPEMMPRHQVLAMRRGKPLWRDLPPFVIVTAEEQKRRDDEDKAFQEQELANEAPEIQDIIRAMDDTTPHDDQ